MADIPDVSTDQESQPMRMTLRRAIGQRDVAAVVAILKGGADPNETNRYRSPLQSAAYIGDAQIESLLLDAGADPKWTNVAGWSALTTADVEGFEEISLILIAAGADPGTRQAHGYSPLHRAVLAGDLEAMTELSKQSPVDIKDSAGETPLMLAIRQRDVRGSELFLQAGADPNVVTDGWSILAQAAYEDAYAQGTDLTKLLLAHGAVPNPQGYPPVMAAISQEGSSVDVIELLISAGADINARDHETVLHRAAGFMADDHLVRRLIELGADLEGRDSEGRTPLLGAIWDGNPPIVSALVACGDMTAVDSEGRGVRDLLGDNEEGEAIRRILDGQSYEEADSSWNEGGPA